MTPDALSNVILECLRVLFMIGVPLLGAAVVGGVVGSLVQSFFAFQDSGITYAVKLSAIVLVLGMLSSQMLAALQTLLVTALHL